MAQLAGELLHSRMVVGLIPSQGIHTQIVGSNPGPGMGTCDPLVWTCMIPLAGHQSHAWARTGGNQYMLLSHINVSLSPFLSPLLCL